MEDYSKKVLPNDGFSFVLLYGCKVLKLVSNHRNKWIFSSCEDITFMPCVFQCCWCKTFNFYGTGFFLLTWTCQFSKARSSCETPLIPRVSRHFPRAFSPLPQTVTFYTFEWAAETVPRRCPRCTAPRCRKALFPRLPSENFMLFFSPAANRKSRFAKLSFYACHGMAWRHQTPSGNTVSRRCRRRATKNPPLFHASYK